MAARKPRTCAWIDNEDFWSTGCGNDWCFIDGGPKENHCHFCPYCGGMIKVEAKRGR